MQPNQTLRRGWLDSLAVRPVLLLLIMAVNTMGFAQDPGRGWRAISPASPSASSNRRESESAVRLVASQTGLDSPTGIDELPQTDGQVWAEYDLRPFTERFSQMPQPQQSVVDWILRETGTETWFSDVAAVLSASRSTLRVYHTPAVQAVVEETVQRFVRSSTSDFQLGARLITVTSPNWRSKALPRMRAVSVQSPGVEAWLLSREDAAVVLADLKKRSDYREQNSPNLLIPNGQTHDIVRRRPLAYVKSIHPNEGLGGNRLEPGEVEEGFSLTLSPLLAQDTNTIDAVIRLETSQVERLSTVNVPVGGGPTSRQTMQIQVPQTSSWRLHERFRWPVNDVLLISCGLVAIPDGEGTVVGLTLLGRSPARADALLFVEAKGVLSEAPVAAEQSARANSWNFRGRY